MKKINFLLFAFCLSTGSFAQTAIDQVSSNNNTLLDSMVFIFPENLERHVLNQKPHYLKAEDITHLEVPSPPRNSSATTRQELDYLLELQRKRTQTEIETCLFIADVVYNVETTPSDRKYQAYRENLFFVGRSIGAWFNARQLPKTADLMANVWRDANYFTWYFKLKYDRVRPYTLEPALDNLQETDWPAYPSGHAANAYISAMIFSALDPEFEDAFFRDAREMAQSREIIGVHFPSDSEASRLLAKQLVEMLFQNDSFKKDFEVAKSEWSRVNRKTSRKK